MGGRKVLMGSVIYITSMVIVVFVAFAVFVDYWLARIMQSVQEAQKLKRDELILLKMSSQNNHDLNVARIGMVAMRQQEKIAEDLILHERIKTLLDTLHLNSDAAHVQANMSTIPDVQPCEEMQPIQQYSPPPCSQTIASAVDSVLADVENNASDKDSTLQ